MPNVRKITHSEEIAEEVALRNRTTQMRGYKVVGFQQTIMPDETIVVLANNARRVYRRHSIIVRVDTLTRDIIGYEKIC